MILSDNVEISFTDRKRIAHAYGKTGRFLLATSNFFFYKFHICWTIPCDQAFEKDCQIFIPYTPLLWVLRVPSPGYSQIKLWSTIKYFLLPVKHYYEPSFACIMFYDLCGKYNIVLPQESHPKCTGTTPTRSNNPAALVQPPAYITGMRTHHNRGKFSQMRFVKFQSNCYRRYQNKHRPYYL